MIYNKIAKSTISQKCGYNIIKLHKKKLQLQIAKSAITDILFAIILKIGDYIEF